MSGEMRGKTEAFQLKMFSIKTLLVSGGLLHFKSDCNKQEVSRVVLGFTLCPHGVNVTHCVSVLWSDHLSCGHRLRSLIQQPPFCSLLPLPEYLLEVRMTRSDICLLSCLCQDASPLLTEGLSPAVKAPNNHNAQQDPNLPLAK